MKVFLICALLLGTVSGFYTEEDDVTELNADSFKPLVVDSKDFWIVEFYAPWCGHCKALAPEWKKLGTVLKGIAQVGAVDMTQHKAVSEWAGEIEGFPTIKAFSVDKTKPSTYEGERDAKALASYVLKEIKDLVKSRLGIKVSKKEKKDVPDKVITLTDANFEETVLKSDDFWLVEFYAPWCGHCKKLAPEWKKAATALDGKVKLGALDATVHSASASKYDIKGYPTIKAWLAGEKADPIEFDGGRTEAAIVKWAAEKGGFPVPQEPKDKKGGNSDVVTCTESNFDQEVMQTEDLVLVEFYAPWCGHCKNLAPHWKKAATKLKGKGVKLVQVDATVETALASKYGVNGYPTIKVFAKGPKGEAEDFTGGRTTDEIVEAALELLDGEKKDEGPDFTVTLTDATFEEQVMKSNELWLVEFYAPWCGHCKRLTPEWKKSAAELEGKVKFGLVDCTKENALKDKYKVESFPTIKVFGSNKDEPEAYEGGRVKSSIVAAATELLEDMNAVPRPVLQLTSQEVFDEQCTTDLCLVAFLPHILDTGAAGREAYLDVLRDQATKHKKQKIGFLWSEAVAQSALESSLNIGGGGYPALTAVSIKKGRHIPLFGEFSLDGVSTFMKRVISGKETPVKLRELGKIFTVEGWDGKDGELPKEDL